MKWPNESRWIIYTQESRYYFISMHNQLYYYCHPLLKMKYDIKKMEREREEESAHVGGESNCPQELWIWVASFSFQEISPALRH